MCLPRPPHLVVLSLQVVRAICILDHPLPKTKPSDKGNKYGGAMSAQIIIPANQVHENHITLLMLR